MKIKVFSDIVSLTHAINEIQCWGNVEKNCTYTVFDPTQHSEFFQENPVDLAGIRGIYEFTMDYVEIWFTHKLSHEKTDIITLVFVNIQEKRVMLTFDQPSISECFCLDSLFPNPDECHNLGVWKMMLLSFIIMDEECERAKKSKQHKQITLLELYE